MKRFLLAALLCAVSGGLLAVPFPAPSQAQQTQPSQEEIAAFVSERQADMKGFGRAMKQLGGIFRGSPPYDRDAVTTAAESIASHSGEKAQAHFPDASLGVPGSEALPAIADERERFQSLFAELEMRGAHLVALARQQDNDRELREAFARLGQTCSACHTAFRAKN